MEEPTDFQGFPTQEAPPMIPNAHWPSETSMPPGLQMSPAPLMPGCLLMPQSLPLPAGLQTPLGLLMPHCVQMPQSLPLPPGLQTPLGHLMPHCIPMPQSLPLPADLQIPQSTPLSKGLQMSLEPPVNPGFQVSPRPSDPPRLPLPATQVPPNPEVTPLAPRKKRKRTIYSKKQRSDLEAYFRVCKYPTYQQYEELAERFHLTLLQIQAWFKNRRVKHAQKHPQGHRKTPRNREGGTQAKHTSKRDCVPAHDPATGDPMSPGLSDISSLLQPSPSNISPDLKS